MFIFTESLPANAVLLQAMREGGKDMKREFHPIKLTLAISYAIPVRH